MNLLIFTLQMIVILLLLRLSYTDIRDRIIDNNVILALLVIILPISFLKYQTIFILPAVFALMIGFLLFTLRVIGAGDVKLVSVLMLMIPLDELIYFFFFIAFAGLLLIVVGWLFYRKSIRERGLPYGVAISLGFLTNLALSGVPSA